MFNVNGTLELPKVSKNGKQFILLLIMRGLVQSTGTMTCPLIEAGTVCTQLIGVEPINLSGAISVET